MGDAYLSPQQQRREIAMKNQMLLTILLIAACGGGDDGDTFDAGTTDATQEETQSEAGASTNESSGPDSSGTAETGVEGTDGSGDGDGDGDSGDGDGDGTGDSMGDGDGDSSSTSVSTGDGDGDGGDGDTGVGEVKLPGDACDPFVDECLEGYECQVNDAGSDANPEFRCRELITGSWFDGTYGAACGSSTSCLQGLKCELYSRFPDGDCETSSRCCLTMCTYQEVCDGGYECTVTWWPADLEDYLDDYVGIGVCEAP